MVVSARIYVEHQDMALTPTIRSCSEATIGVVSDAGTDPGTEVYAFWIAAPDFERIESALAEDHTVADFTRIVEKGDRRTYQIEYSDEALLITPAIDDLEGIVLNTESHARGWELRLELPDHETLYRLHEEAQERDIRLDVLDIRQRRATGEDTALGLTDAQVEALVCAHVHGYYDQPREISLEGLASILDISQTAVSGRLRRGASQLVEEILIDDEE